MKNGKEINEIMKDIMTSMKLVQESIETLSNSVMDQYIEINKLQHRVKELEDDGK